MRKPNAFIMAAIAALTALVLGFGLSRPLIGDAAGEQIVVTTEPPLSEIHPHGGPGAAIKPDKLIIEARDAAGNPIPNVLFRVRLDAPPTNWLISTDVPLVEGKTLLDLTGVAPNGRLEVEYIFPIRGTYHLSVTASPAPGAATTFAPFSRTVDLPISEKPASMLNLGLFLFVLFAFGLVSGIVLGRSHAATRARVDAFAR